MNTVHSSPAVVSTNITLVIGGYVGVAGWTATVEVLHMRSKRWYVLNNLPLPLFLPSATICGSQLHILGLDGAGYSCSLQALLSSDQPVTSLSISNFLKWTPLPQLPVEYSTAATLCGQLVIVGGEQGMLQVNSIHQLIGGQWVEISTMSGCREKCLVVTPSPDKMMVVGGYGALYSISERDSVEECVVV